jgi:uncharacterized membrane protein
MFKHLRTYFFTGLFFLLPLVITLKLIFWAFEKTDAILGNFIHQYFSRYFTIFGIHITREIPGLGLIALLIVITLTGIFAKNYLGRKFIKFGESVLGRIPILSSVYNLLKQVTQSFASSQTGKGAFRKVVLVEYPRAGIYSPGFLIGETAEECENKVGQELIAVFIPTVPNPTTGFLIYVPKAGVIILDMSVEDGLKLILSAGMIRPDQIKSDPVNTA